MFLQQLLFLAIRDVTVVLFTDVNITLQLVFSAVIVERINKGGLETTSEKGNFGVFASGRHPGSSACVVPFWTCSFGAVLNGAMPALVALQSSCWKIETPALQTEPNTGVNTN